MENLTGYSHGFDFGAAAKGVPFGRYVTSQGAEHFVAQAATTLGATNSMPRVGPIVISEIMYHPVDHFDGVNFVDNSIDEFVELHNISTRNVSLTGPPGALEADFLNTWALSEAIDFKFPNGSSISAGSYAVVVSFDPSNMAQLASFISKYGISTNTPIFGPYRGALNNSACIKLNRPDVASTNGNVPYIEVDRVDYTDTAPWPSGGDGIGLSLNRIIDAAYGNDPINWAAARPTPGSRFAGGTLAVITQQPQNVTVIEGTSTNLSVAVAGLGPFSYQWLFNGKALPNATVATLALPNILIDQTGQYSVAVLNAAGAVFSASARIVIQRLPVITVQPANVRTNQGSNYTFSVNAVGIGPLDYQWFFNGTNISGATNATLALTNLQLEAHAGFYTVLVTDALGSRLSETGSLVVLVKPVITNNPAAVPCRAG
jgi:hypothetical protein